MRPGSLAALTPPGRPPALALALWAALAGACGDPGGTPTPREGAPASPPAGAPAPAPAPEGAPRAPARVATAPANGFGSKIAWRGLAEGLREAAAEHKPLMLVVHASWCPRCKELRPTFFDPALVAASDHLVMVNVDQDEEPQSMLYSPDGTYVPRVVFLDPSGAIDPQLKNSARDRFFYFYTPADDLVGMMKQAIARHGQS